MGRRTQKAVARSDSAAHVHRDCRQPQLSLSRDQQRPQVTECDGNVDGHA